MHTRNSKAVHAQVQKNMRTRWSIKHVHAQFKIMHTRRSMKTCARASQIVFNREFFPFLPQAKYTDSLIKLLKTDMNKVRRQLFLFSFLFLILMLVDSLENLKSNEKRTGRPGEESSPLTPHVFRVTLFLRFFLFPSQIKAYVDCGKLKSAYLIAVKEDRVEAIQEIAETAMKTGQSKIVEICKKWLSQYQKRREVQERSVTQRRRTNNR